MGNLNAKQGNEYAGRYHRHNRMPYYYDFEDMGYEEEEMYFRETAGSTEQFKIILDIMRTEYKNASEEGKLLSFLITLIYYTSHLIKKASYPSMIHHLPIFIIHFVQLFFGITSLNIILSLNLELTWRRDRKVILLLVVHLHIFARSNEMAFEFCSPSR